MERFHKGAHTTQEKRVSGETDWAANSNQGGVRENDADSEAPKGDDDITTGQYRIFFNIPLPDDAKDEAGRPIAHFGRNKIRTAKYTPLTFIPKNLWYQFHNIANVYFLILIILSVSNHPLPWIYAPALTLIYIDFPTIWQQ